MWPSQLKSHYCAPASVQIGLQMYGISYSQNHIAKVLGTTPEGTDEQDILQAGQKLRYHPVSGHFASAAHAIAWLEGELRWSPVLLCVEDWGHWVCAVGLSAGGYLVIDPDRAFPEWPVVPVTSAELAERWACANVPGPYYAISMRTLDTVRL